MFQSCVIPCLQIAKKYNIGVLLAPRGELCNGALRKKFYKKIPYIFLLRRAGLFKNIIGHSTSKEETEAMTKWLGVVESNISNIRNIPYIPTKEYSQPNKYTGCGRIVFLSRIHPKKNLVTAIKSFANVKGDVIFDIYGPIEDKKYWETCEYEIQKLPQNIRVNYKGIVDHEIVHEIMSKYDAMILPTHSENYGHSIVESLMVGTPVIISDQTPWNGLEKDGVGWNIPYKDVDGYGNAVQQIIDMNSKEINQMRINASEYVKKRVDLEDLRKNYDAMLKRAIRSTI